MDNDSQYLSSESIVPDPLAALSLSVAYHGLSCLADDSVPAKTSTVLTTADTFLTWLDTKRDQ